MIAAIAGFIAWLAEKLLGRWLTPKPPPTPVQQLQSIDDAQKQALADKDPTGKATSNDLGSGRF